MGGRGQRTRLRRARSRGFSLIEILAAFTILTLFIATTFQVFSTGMRSTTLAGEHVKALTVARSKLAELAASPELVPGEQSGEVVIAAGAPPLRWRTTLTEYTVPNMGANGLKSSRIPLRAVVEVTWGGKGGATAPRRFELRALLVGKGPSP